MKLATLCYVQTATKTLMLHRVKKENDMHEGKWNGLGGKIEAGETPEECVIREIEEESGLKISSPILKGFLTFPAFDGFDDWYVFVFVAKEFSGKLINSDEGNLQWIETKKLLDLNLWEGDRVFLPLLAKPGVFSAKFRYDEGKLVDHIVHTYH